MKYLLVALVALSLLTSVFAAEKPNIIHIMADELGYYEPAFMGGKTLQTPNLDRMAAEGMKFTNMFGGSSVCAPTRCCFLTGKHGGHASVRANGGGTPLRADETTIASMLKPLGYATGGFGKWGCGGRGSTGVPEKHGFDIFLGYYDQVHAHTYYPPYLIQNSGEVPLPSNDGKDRNNPATYAQYVIHDAAKKFIRENATKPFFAYLPYTPPHGSFQIPDSDPAWALYKDQDWPADARRYAAMVTMLDRQIGEIQALLKELGIEQDTLVCFSGDNGGADYFVTPQHPRGVHSANKHPVTGVEYRGKKGTLYEGGLRVPFLARWPGKIAPGTSSDLLAYFPDMMPTYADVAHVTVPENVDGLSIVPTLLGKDTTQKIHDYLYWEINGWTAIRQGQWRAVKPGKSKTWELYDLASDPSESKNLAAAHPELLAKLTALAAAAHQPVREGTFANTDLHERDRRAKYGKHDDPNYIATPSGASKNDAATKADVIVFGATPGGFSAAIAAAREGASVILLEPTTHAGGVNTGGLCFSDSNQTVRSTVLGLFEEWHARVEKDYRQRGVELPYKVSEKDHKPWTYEPHVAAKITKEMLNEAGVKVLTKQALKSVIKEGPRITQITTSEGDFAAKVFIDGTYEGDLMAATGVSWTIGREGRNEFGESLAGKQYPKKKMAMSGLGADGKPLPFITTTDAGPPEDGDKNVMVYSFRLCVTKDEANRVPFPKPANYDPARFEVVRRYFAQEKRPQLLWDLYPLPGNKFDANNGIGKQFSMGLVGACNGWSEANEASRAMIWESHKQYTLEMYHFLTTDLAVPTPIREEYTKIGLCRDEFPEYGHWSPQLYVREGRRMIGEFVVSQKDIMEEPEKDDAIIVSSFPIDSHDCQRVGTDKFVINEGTIMPVRMSLRGHGYPYHIPYRAITPKAAECANLLVPVALSCTHVGMSSIRVEPTWMILGQSAGVAAALAAKQGVTVQELSYPALRERLLAQKQALDLPVLPDLPPNPAVPLSIDPKTLPGIVLDDSQAEIKGAWSRSSSFNPHIGTGYLHDDKRADGQSIAIFRFKAPKSGRYELRMAYSAHETRATKVPVTIQSGAKTGQLTVDQTKSLPAGEAFRSVGFFELSADAETVITLSNKGTDGFVILDALQLLETKD